VAFFCAPPVFLRFYRPAPDFALDACEMGQYGRLIGASTVGYSPLVIVLLFGRSYHMMNRVCSWLRCLVVGWFWFVASYPKNSARWGFSARRHGPVGVGARGCLNYCAQRRVFNFALTITTYCYSVCVLRWCGGRHWAYLFGRKIWLMQASASGQPEVKSCRSLAVWQRLRFFCDWWNQNTWRRAGQKVGLL